MSVTHYLSILFSRQRWRHALLAALLLHFGLGAYAFTQDIAPGLNLSLLINSVQFALIQAALMLLYSNTSKQEGQRYSLDTRFYLTHYKDERHRFLALQRRTTGGTRALAGIPASELLVPGLMRLTSRRDLMISQSVLEWAPQRRMMIDEVTFELMDEWYELPWIVAEHGLDTILKRFNAVDRYDYNGLTLATHDWRATSDRFALRFKKSFYYNYLATNMLPEMRLPGGLTYRDLLEPGPGLSDLDTALPENHLGLSCLIRTRDGALIIPRRSQHTNVFKGQLSPSVSGAANLSTCRAPSGGYSPLAWLIQELIEELPFLAYSEEAFAEPLSQCLQRAEFLGMTRELRRCGKPEIFFYLPLEIDAERVMGLWNEHQQGDGSAKQLSGLQGIDHNENAGLLLIDEAELFQRITPKAVLSKRRWPSAKPLELHVTLPQGDKADILSESLLANLILYRLKYPAATA
ncbi:hypothetical protein RAN53_10225 [Halomonas sp. SSL-5]|uniref:hypothetical protein n=1 Tax=Halomonas sp. SSL-5 TaxID=3065855 RepID=UPI002738544D|nr:hypothetical protein [Halomonas sp. SSL-5]MDY7116726.1 hypothetical protein [Halomonas sp. SSL-5]